MLVPAATTYSMYNVIPRLSVKSRLMSAVRGIVQNVIKDCWSLHRNVIYLVYVVFTVATRSGE
jgi:hypothetical protein